jgi:hypothetical protein
VAGSNRAFNYITDSGNTVAVRGDESNIEAVNGAAAVAPLGGSPYTFPADKCRFARYVNVATGAVRVVIVVSQAALAVLPVLLNFWVQANGTTGSVLPFSLVTTRGERLSRYAGGDSGLTDGDTP